MASYPNFVDRSPPGLVDAVCERVRTALKDFWQPGEFPDEEFHTPFVHAQYLPISLTESKERDKSKDYPIVMVLCSSGIVEDFNETELGSKVTIEIQFGGYSKETDNQGWRIPMMMMWRVMQDLMSETICGGYQLTTPIEWTPVGNKEPPYYTAVMKTTWQGAPPAVEAPYEGTAPRFESE